MSGDSPQQSAAGRLYVCGTPIGNLGDVSQRLISTLEQVDVIAAEDTRRTRALLSGLAVAAPKLLSYRSDNEADSAQGLLDLLQQGRSIALVSDAGTPGISDPGSHVVRAALEAGVEVVAVPGPSALAAAYSVSGISASALTFVGFLPRKEAELRGLLRERAHDALAAFESARRVLEALRVVADEQPTRRVVVARELTKQHEQVLAGSAAEVAEQLERQDSVRGEMVVMFDALVRAREKQVTAASLAQVRELVGEGVRLRRACQLVAAWTGAPSRELYEAVSKE